MYETLRRFLTVGAMAALAACGDDAPGPVETGVDLLDRDVALLAADAAAEDLAVMTDLFQGTIPGAPTAVSSELVRSRSVEFFDAEGTEQNAYDPLATASIHTVLELEGEVERMGLSMAIARSRDMWVTGLEGEETTRTWNGSGADTRYRTRVSDEAGTRAYSMAGTLTIEDVVRGVPRAEFPWPLSGTVTRTLQVEVLGGPQGNRSVSRTVVVTFNGQQVVTLTVDGEEYEFDLARTDRQRVRLRQGQR
ncbi:MAG: hypothetical protein P8188_02545 [Gemmatimonadota bacterium]